MATLTRIHTALAPNAIHIIFVHGLGGEARSTWMHNPKDHTTLWPNWIGEDIGCHVWVAGYEAAPSGWTGEAMHLVDLGEALFAALQAESTFQGKKLVLIGHSLGGLVIKSGMTQAASLGDPRRVALLDTVAGVVFVATPHQSSSLATLAHRLRVILRTNSPVTNMVRDDSWLKLINSQFRNLQHERRFSVRVLFETKVTYISWRTLFLFKWPWQLIVDANSCDPGITLVVPTGIDGDHLQVAKPKSRLELAHKTLVEFLVGVTNVPPSGFPVVNYPHAGWHETGELALRMRNASALLLSWPSTLPDGTWLPRPELHTLIANVVGAETSTHLLLGEPGCGKSSLLVRLAQEKQEAGWVVLAIKADSLPPNLLNREALTRHLNLGAETSSVLRRLAKSGPVLVVIDQVDALADLVVQQSARLRVLLDLVQDLCDAPGVHTVISCRTFEQRHDPALRNLDATTLTLDFHGLLEKQWETQVTSDPTGKRKVAIQHLAKLMADREVLGLPLAIVENHFVEIQALASSGLLLLDKVPGRVEFRHQTLYEFVRARSFLEESGSLTETVLAHQSSMRIRPQLWHALGYFRGASPEDYGTEINRLWATDLRPHLKMLLIEFLGRQTMPLPVERQLVERALPDKWFLPRFIGAAIGSPEWFAVLAPTHLPRMMSPANDQAQMLLPLLRQALHFDTDTAVGLVVLHWLPNQTRDELSWQVLGFGDVVPRIGNWLNSLVTIAGRTPIAEWSIGHLAGVVSAAFPAEAPRIVAAWLKRQIESAEVPLPTLLEDDETVAVGVSQRVQIILEARQFHDMEAIAQAAPQAFVVNIWPLLLQGLSLCATDEPGVVVCYRQISGLTFQDLDEEKLHQDCPLIRSVQLAVQAWAETDAAGYLDFADEYAGSDLLLVHRFLSYGRIRAARHLPLRVFDYLVTDARRLVMGPYSDVHKESIALIKALSPLLNKSGLALLETTLINWHYYTATAQADDDVNVRHRRLRRARQHRLRLLRALPAAHRSRDLQRLVAEEERAFPSLEERDVYFSGMQAIESPVSSEQMAKASDADVLNLFSELTDASEWDHPRHRMTGGAIQAGRELASLAKKDLGKALRILKALKPGLNEIPVGLVLRELIPGGLAATALYALVAELEDKGFVSADFRQDAASAIGNAVGKESPVPDELIDRMERWLMPLIQESTHQDESDSTGYQSSVLWGHGSFMTLPNGNYPTLSALTASCLCAEPARIDRWLDILEGHTSRYESPKVWEALLRHELLNLRTAERARAESLIDTLLDKFPSIVNGRAWVHFVAHAYHWCSRASAQRWVMRTLNEATNSQGAGELIGLRYARSPEEIWSRELAYSLATGETTFASRGLAFCVAHLWHEPITRPVVHPLLLQLLCSVDKQVLDALSELFLTDGFAADPETRELLDAFVVYPSVLKNGRAEHLPELLAKLVAAEPERVCRVAHALLDTAGDQMGNIATSWYLGTEWLLDIALQLQDLGNAQRAAGSMLFERMLEFNIPQAVELTLNLDKRMPGSDFPRPNVSRRSRTKQPRPARNE